MRVSVMSLVLATLPACGTARVAPTHGTPDTPPAPAASSPESEVPLTPVAEPAGLVLVGRATRAGADDLALLGFPRLITASSRFAPSTQGIEELADAHGVYEFAWVVDGPESLMSRQFTAVVSIPLTSWNEARSRMLALRRDSDDEITRTTDGNVLIESSYGSCSLGRALGASPARIVCAGTRAAIERLDEYAFRGLPTRDFGAGTAVLELFPSRAVKGQEEKYDRIVKLLAPMLSRLGTSSARPLLEPMLETLLPEMVDLTSDLEHVRFALEQQNGDVVVSGRVELASARSWTARTLGGVASQADAREMFRRLPQDSTLAWFNSASRPERMDEARKTLASWIRNYMGAGFRPDTANLVANTFIPRAPMVYAQGDLVDADARYADGGKRIYEKTLSTYGWHIVAFAEKASLYEPELDRGMRAYNNGDLRNFAYRELPRLCPGLPKITRRPALGGLPRGSVLYEMSIPRKFFDDCANRHGRTQGDPAPRGASLNVILVPDGNVTWIGFSAEERILRKQLASVFAQKGTLKEDASLALLESGDAKFGGFLSLAGLGGLERFLTMDDYAEWGRSRVATRPQKGRTRMPFRMDVAQNGDGTTVSLSARMPRAMVEDIRHTGDVRPASLD